MSSHGARARWIVAIPGLTLTIWLAAVSSVAWHGLGHAKTRIGNRLVQMITRRGPEAGEFEVIPSGPMRMSDPRLIALRQAAETWKRSTGPRRWVVDQVCLVPDVPAFFEAIANWDEHYFFPILIDEPAWTLPFLRAFRPARVVRVPGAKQARRIATRAGRSRGCLVESRDSAVARAWSGLSGPDDTLASPVLLPRELGATPPGIVLSAPEAPMLAGAVALAAGRFEPLVRVNESPGGPGGSGDSSPPKRFGEVLGLVQALQFARSVESRVAAVVPRYDQLGDKCDFLTIADEWPYRYSCEVGDELHRGLYALDDLIGRRIELGVRGPWFEKTRRRWAYTGRLLGDSAASVARAMGSLFLQPGSTLLWNTYQGAKPWSDFTMNTAARELAPAFKGGGTIVERSGEAASLANWHQMVDPVNRFGMVLINSSGGPDWFRISGGMGRPADIPRSVPANVAMIHSFSAADPTDPQTIAGRWLAQGAFNYFGAVYEPYLLSFRAASPGRRADRRRGPPGCCVSTRRVRDFGVSVATLLPGRPALPSSKREDHIRRSFRDRRRGPFDE